MSKYDKMIETNRERSVEKVAAVKAAIRKMAEDGERISVPRLMKMTGLSRGFFYKNPEVRSEIDRAMEQRGRDSRSPQEYPRQSDGRQDRTAATAGGKTQAGK